MRLVSLLFIPVQYLQETFDNLMGNFDESVVDFTAYVETTYI